MTLFISSIAVWAITSILILWILVQGRVPIRMFEILAVIFGPFVIAWFLVDVIFKGRKP